MQKMDDENNDGLEARTLLFLVLTFLVFRKPAMNDKKIKLFSSSSPTKILFSFHCVA